ncbi:MAG: thioredoxin-like domain-containing protein [Thermoguttaceae bacterium]|nr:thioredoxin-like domain-containing protein [Thermoguttaceae bacterium]
MLSRTVKMALGTVACLVCVQGLVFGQASAKSQTEIALQYKPVQENVEYTIPSAEDAKSCKSRKIDGGIRVIDGNGMTLREIIDTTDDKVPDQWRYFLNGLEVYRESDTDGDKKKDQFHWFNMAGTRLGVDTDADGKIDEWKILSAQELSAEIALALANGDTKRFETVLLTADELKNLGLGQEKYELVKEKLLKAREGFAAVVGAQKVTPAAKWMQFNGTRPSAWPQGTDGSEKDVEFYENASAVVHDGENDVEIAVGTLVKIGNVWKCIDAPTIATADNINEIAANNVFITFTNNTNAAAGEGGAQSSEELNKLDEQINQAQNVAEMAELHAKRADLLENMAKNAGPEERSQWIHTLADGVTGAIQQGVYPDGIERLQKLLDSLKENEEDKALAAYVQFRLMSSEYTISMMKNSGTATAWLQVRTKWLEDLQAFIEEYPDAPDTAEAMLQLALENENDGAEDKALALYKQIATKFSDSTSAAKANGALARLTAEGKPLAYAVRVLGQEDKQVDIAKLRGKVVVLHFWASWMSDAVREFDQLKALQAKYPKELLLLGVNLDDDPAAAQKFVEDNHVTWYQLFEKGGMESRPANALGIFNVPTIMVIGADGNVIARNVLSSELEKVVADAAKKVPTAPAAAPKKN